GQQYLDQHLGASAITRPAATVVPRHIVQLPLDRGMHASRLLIRRCLRLGLDFVIFRLVIVFDNRSTNLVRRVLQALLAQRTSATLLGLEGELGGVGVRVVLPWGQVSTRAPLSSTCRAKRSGPNVVRSGVAGGGTVTSRFKPSGSVSSRNTGPL